MALPEACTVWIEQRIEEEYLIQFQTKQDDIETVVAEIRDDLNLR